MEEAALFDVRAITSAWTEVEAGASADEIAEHLPVTVVVPTRAGAALGASTDLNCALSGERNLADDSWVAGRLPQAVGREGSDSPRLAFAVNRPVIPAGIKCRRSDTAPRPRPSRAAAWFDRPAAGRRPML